RRSIITQYQTPLSGSLTFNIEPRLTLSNSDWENRWSFSVLLSVIEESSRQLIDLIFPIKPQIREHVDQANERNRPYINFGTASLFSFLVGICRAQQAPVDK